MLLFIVLILLALIFLGAGFALHLLWILAIVFFVAWLVALVVRR